jgi:hypothetical protein
MNHRVRHRMRAKSSQGEKACRRAGAQCRQAGSASLVDWCHPPPRKHNTARLCLTQPDIGSPATGSRCPTDAAPPPPTGFLPGKRRCTGGSQRCTPRSTAAASRCPGSAGRPPPAAACCPCQKGRASPRSATPGAAVPCLQAAADGGSMGHSTSVFEPPQLICAS